MPTGGTGRTWGRRYAAALATAALLGGLPAGSALADTQAPSIDGESVADVTEHDATLQAQIDPHGEYIGYEFQVDATGAFDFAGPACPFRIPGFAECEAIIAGGETLPGGVPPGPEYLAGGEGDQSVSLDLASIGASLQPDTTYHYRVIATAGGPIIDGADQTFATPGPPSAPPSAPPSGTPPASPAGPPGGSSVPSVASPAVSGTTPTAGQSDRPSSTAPKLCEHKPKRKRSRCRKLARRGLRRTVAAA